MMRAAVPGALFVLAMGFLLMARGFPPASRMVPEMIGGAMLVLSALDMASRSATAGGRALAGWLNPAAPDTRHDVGPAGHQPVRSRQLLALGGLMGFVALIVLVGVLPSVPVFVTLAVRFGGRRGWTASLLAAAIVTLLIWLLFALLLRLDLFPGLLLGGDW